MLQNIGDKLKSQRWLATLLLGLLALIFAAWGAYGIVNISFAPQDYGLKINGERVSTETLNRAWQERQAQYAQALNGATLAVRRRSKLMQQQLVDEYVRRDRAAPARTGDGLSRQQGAGACRLAERAGVPGRRQVQSPRPPEPCWRRSA